jgi:hypothetical protein
LRIAAAVATMRTGDVIPLYALGPLQFPQMLSRDLDAVLDESQEHTGQLLVIPIRETACRRQEIAQRTVARREGTASVLILDVVSGDAGDVRTRLWHPASSRAALQLECDHHPPYHRHGHLGDCQ